MVVQTFETIREEVHFFQEQNLDAAALGRRSDLMQVPELADYLKYMKWVHFLGFLSQFPLPLLALLRCFV